MISKINLKIILGFLILLALPIISAYSWSNWGSGYYADSPLAYLDNEWVRFAILFSLLFAVIYFAVHKTFKNSTISGVVSVGVALLISISLGQRGLLYSYTGDVIGDTAIIIGLLIAGLALVKVIMSNFRGFKGIVLSIISILIILSFVDIDTLLPGSYAYSPFGNFLGNLIDFISNFFGIFLFIGVVALIIAISKRKEKVKRLYEGGAELISEVFSKRHH